MGIDSLEWNLDSRWLLASVSFISMDSVHEVVDYYKGMLAYDMLIDVGIVTG